jgi:hypothetical protein
VEELFPVVNNVLVLGPFSDFCFLRRFVTPHVGMKLCLFVFVYYLVSISSVRANKRRPESVFSLSLSEPLILPCCCVLFQSYACMDALLPHLQAHAPSLTKNDLAPVASSRVCVEAITRLVHELEACRQNDEKAQRERALDRDKASSETDLLTRRLLC